MPIADHDHRPDRARSSRELAPHLRAALRNGLTRDDIKAALLLAAIYRGVPHARSTHRIAQRVFTGHPDR